MDIARQHISKGGKKHHVLTECMLSLPHIPSSFFQQWSTCLPKENSNFSFYYLVTYMIHFYSVKLYLAFTSYHPEWKERAVWHKSQDSAKKRLLFTMIFMHYCVMDCNTLFYSSIKLPTFFLHFWSNNGNIYFSVCI